MFRAMSFQEDRNPPLIPIPSETCAAEGVVTRDTGLIPLPPH
jgi:hypothetical protein